MYRALAQMIDMIHIFCCHLVHKKLLAKTEEICPFADFMSLQIKMAL